jgi:hypothetical protein
MTGFFRRLASRAIGAETPLSPRLPGLFEGETGVGFDDSVVLEPSVETAPGSLPGERLFGAPSPSAAPGVATSTGRVVPPPIAPSGSPSPPAATVAPNDVAAVPAPGQRLAGFSTEAARRAQMIAPPSMSPSATAPMLSRLARPNQIRRSTWSGQTMAPAQPAINRSAVTQPTGSAPSGLVSSATSSSRPTRIDSVAQADASDAALQTGAPEQALPSFATRGEPGSPSAAHQGAPQSGGQSSAAPDAVEISIGRIDIRFPPAPAAPAPAPSRHVGPPPLADLLARSRRRAL